MFKLPTMLRPSFPIFGIFGIVGIVLGLAGIPAYSQQGAAPDRGAPEQDMFPGYVATRTSSSFEGVSASPATAPFPGVKASPIRPTPLSGPPYVFSLEQRDPAAMTPDDAAVVSSLGPELAGKAALVNFDLGAPGWRYRQIVCPALPDYVLLDFQHGPDPGGSSRFVAALARNGPQVRIVSTFSHGLLPFDSAWSKPATYEIFNHMLRQERGLTPLGPAPNWLVIAMCYAELSGNHVQVLTPNPLPGSTLDLDRLEANRPQLHIMPDHSARITFSDASRPSYTTAWVLRFNRHGQIVSAAHNGQRQSSNIALKP